MIINFYIKEKFQERVAKKIKKYFFRLEPGLSCFFIVVAENKRFYGDFLIHEMSLGCSYFSITGTAFVNSLDEKEESDIFFVDTKCPSKTFKIKYNWIKSLEIT